MFPANLENISYVHSIGSKSNSVILFKVLTSIQILNISSFLQTITIGEEYELSDGSMISILASYQSHYWQYFPLHSVKNNGINLAMFP